MQLIRSIALIALVTLTADAFSLKSLFGSKIPKSSKDLAKAKGDNLDLANKVIKEWNGKSKAPSGKDSAKKSDMRIKYLKTQALNGKDYTPIFVKKGKKFYGGVKAEQGCSKKKKIDGETLKKALKKAVEKKEITTVNCGSEDTSD